MNEPKMPTTLPSPVDRADFKFLAVDPSGTVWRWVDEDMVWVRDPDGAPLEPDAADPPLPVH